MLQYFGHLMQRTDSSGKDPDAEKEWGHEETGEAEDEMVGWHHWLNGHEFEQTLGESGGLGSLICCSSWGQKELDMTSVQFRCSVMSDSLGPHESQHTRPPCPSPTPGVYSNSCPLSWWHYLTISSSAFLLSFCLQFLPASRSLQVSWLFTSGAQNIGDSVSASVLPMNIQGWFPSGLTGLISLLSNGPSRGFSNTTVQKHQFFCAQLSLSPNSHIHTWPLEKP